MLQARWSRARAFLLTLSLTWTLLTGASAAADSRDPLRNRLLWIKGNRAYVALGDTSLVAEGDSVRFEDRRRHVAGGRVLSVVHGEMAVVSVTSGSLDRVRLDRVNVSVITGGAAPSSLIRIALPADDRGNLLFRCGRVTPRLPALAPTYRVELIDARVYRMTRDPGPAEWPDTVLIHLFVDSADEEIALERGDVDIAIFWPGELSTRMREHARWRGSPSGVLDGRILAFVGGLDVSDAVPDTASARALRDDLFRGDLTTDGLPWGGPRSDLQRRYWQFLSQNLELDVPGAPQIRQWIAQQKGIIFTGAKLPRARLTIIEDAPDRTDSGTHPVFRLRCPVVCAAALRPFVDAIGADVFANLARCPEVPR